MRNKNSGFTIVELLIVIVIIGILAAITIVAYNGIQARAQDAQRISEMDKLKNSLAVYYQLNGQYPKCGGNTVCTSTGNAAWGAMSDLPVSPAILNDPKNSAGNWGYYYATGFKSDKNGNVTQTNSTNDYLIGTRLANGQIPTYTAWDNANLNYVYSVSSN